MSIPRAAAKCSVQHSCQGLAEASGSPMFDSLWPEKVEGFYVNLLYFVSNSEDSANNSPFDLL